jgi:hypothetical protein
LPAFGYKNHLSIDRQHVLIRRFAVTHAAAHDGRQLGAILDPANTASQVWADTAYRSKANLALLERRGLAAELQRPKPRGRPMPAHIRRANALRATVRSAVRSAVEHVFAAQKSRTKLVIRTVGIARARAKLALANITYNLTRLALAGTPSRTRLTLPQPERSRHPAEAAGRRTRLRSSTPHSPPGTAGSSRCPGVLGRASIVGSHVKARRSAAGGKGEPSSRLSDAPRRPHDHAPRADGYRRSAARSADRAWQSA